MIAYLRITTPIIEPKMRSFKPKISAKGIVKKVNNILNHLIFYLLYLELELFIIQYFEVKYIF